MGLALFLQIETSNLGPDFIVPTLLTDATDNMLIAREETFGPVAAVLPFDSEEDVIARANASEMGLAGYRLHGQPASSAPAF